MDQGIPQAIPGRGTPRRSPFIAGRAPLGGLSAGPAPTRRSPFIRGTESLTRGVQQLSIKAEVKHPGVKPSVVNSQSITSTGCGDLDKILGHQGLPLGTMLLVEESGTTDFGSVLAKEFASQGIVHNRLNAHSPNTYVIVLSSNQQWAKELPGVYKGSSRDVKKQKVIENEKKLSVQNLIGDTSNPARGKDLKIAWRYGLNDSTRKQQPLDNELHKDFNHQFDITTRLTPSPGSNELTFVPLGTSFKPVLKQIEHIVSQHKDKVIRLIIPSFLNPSMYSPILTKSQEVLPFVHSLRSMTRKYPKLVITTTISIDLYPRESSLIKNIELLSDGVIHLEPFNQEMMKILEKAYHNQPTKVQHGLVHIYKLPHMSERGQMMVIKGEYAFKNGRKKFEIEEWGIPVEDEGQPQQTTQNIDF